MLHKGMSLMPGKSRTCQRKGISLVELVLVICILAILLALLIPAVVNVREQSRIVQCLGNLSEIGTALSLYALDNDGFFPPGDIDCAVAEETPDQDRASRTRKRLWFEMLYPYIGPERLVENKLLPQDMGGTVFDCPNNPASAQSLGFDYGYNWEVIRSLGGQVQNLSSPGFQIVVSESDWYMNSWPYNVRTVHSLILGGAGANYLFADGHARWSQRYHLMEPQFSPWKPYRRPVSPRRRATGQGLERAAE